MILKSLKLTNFQKFKEVSLSFEKINIITGINFDNPEDSSNGCGKSTIIRAIRFLLHGKVDKYLLEDLIQFGAKSLSVEGEIVILQNTYRIVRKIPSGLEVYLNGNEIKANTPSLLQNYIDENICTQQFFKEFRVIDIKQGLNILDYTPTNLKKTMMGFLEDMFNDIRTRLLKKKTEREDKYVGKKPYHYYLSEKRLKLLETAYQYFNDQTKELTKQYNEIKNKVSNLQADVKSKNYIIVKNNENVPKQTTRICPYCKSVLTVKATQEIAKKSSQEIGQLSEEIEHLTTCLNEEQEASEFIIGEQTNAYNKKDKIYNEIVRLKEAFKFSDYKYTAKDVAVYSEAVKLLDLFASVYINEWLKTLEIIMNDLLSKVNLRIEFFTDKEFIKVYDNEQVMKYDQLSSGQQCFLGIIFKVAILLHKGLTGLIIADEGLSSLDSINLKSLLTVIKDLPYQWVAVYQNIPKDITEVKFIEIERKDGESKIK